MGLSCSPRVFTKLLKPVFSTLRSSFGISCLGYIDDSFYTDDTLAGCQEATLQATMLLTKLGFSVHREKSVLRPTQQLEYLGFQLNSVSMSVSVTKAKISSIVGLCREFVFKKSGSIRAYRHLVRDKDLALRHSAGNFEVMMILSEESIIELEWWITFLPTASKLINHGPINYTIFVDASRKGWGGGIVDESRTQGLWSLEEAVHDINILEMLAALFGLQALCGHLHKVHIRIMSDNATAVSYINCMGGTKSWSCNSVAYKIWYWAIERNIWLTAAHTPGIKNVEADVLSRNFVSGLEWQMNAGIFSKIVDCFGVPDIYLFASRINHRVPAYASWKPDPNAVIIDAFTSDWSTFKQFYVFPPFCLIARCLQKI
ncbi:uncharacterized protein [Antedon mediterranea]|uniref:uncharacterized protein n=1 Tax=Antedon mediterranea TaxID=105859 RepID=UPI003AF70645